MIWKPFIIGVPRSGTTLLRLMLDAHPMLSIPPETQFLSAIVKIKNPSVEQTIHAITCCPRWADFGLTVEVLREPVPQNVADVVRRFFDAYAAKRGKTQWGDKTPQYGRAMRGIKALLPDAYFIHLIRDGRDAYASWRQTQSPRSVSVEGSAKMWSGYIQQARQQAAAVRDYCELRYEDLVADPEGSLRRVCSKIQLQYDSSMLLYFLHAKGRMEELRSFRSTDGTMIDRNVRLSWHQRLSEPPNTISVGRWRSQLSSADRSTYEKVAGHLLEELGYMANQS